MKNSGLIITSIFLFLIVFIFINNITGEVIHIPVITQNPPPVSSVAQGLSDPNLADFANCQTNFWARDPNGMYLVQQLTNKQSDFSPGQNEVIQNQVISLSKRSIRACKSLLPQTSLLNAKQLYQNTSIKKNDLVYIKCTANSDIINYRDTSKALSFYCGDSSDSNIKIRIFFISSSLDSSKIHKGDDIYVYGRLYVALDKNPLGNEKWINTIFVDDLTSGYSSYMK